MAAASVSSRPSIWQSPWYWLHAFCAAGLIALVLMGGKFSARQSQIERQQVRAAPTGGNVDIDQSAQAETTFITLQPLYIILAVAAIASWVVLWWTHFRRRSIPGGPVAPRQAFPFAERKVHESEAL